jgi:nucleotide-binding universal stress UspA family protein
MSTTRIPIDRILCATDFSGFSERALQHAVQLARWFDAGVTALHVLPLSAASADPAPAACREDAHRRLEAFVAPRLYDGAPIETAIAFGDPARAIEAAAESLPADLVAMGSHGLSGWDRLVLGSTTEKVIRRATVPVLLAGPQKPPAEAGHLFRRIVCGLDLRSTSRRTLELALSFAEEDPGRLTLVHVVEPEIPSYDVLDVVGRQLADAGGRAAERFCELDVRVESGTAWRRILDVATEKDADLVVVGAHATGGFGPSFLGSTASQVIRHAPCPVLVARPAPLARRRLAAAPGALERTALAPDLG